MDPLHEEVKGMVWSPVRRDDETGEFNADDIARALDELEHGTQELASGLGREMVEGHRTVGDDVRIVEVIPVHGLGAYRYAVCVEVNRRWGFSGRLWSLAAPYIPPRA